MGVKKTSRLLAVLIAIALVITSGVSVFATSSPTVSGKNSVKVSGKTLKVTTKSNITSIKYKVKGGNWKTVKVTNGKVNIKVKKHKRYIVKIDGKNYYRVTCKNKIKSVKKSGKKATVKFSKTKCGKKYVVKAVRTSDGKVVKKTVKSASAKLKLAKGTWKITVTLKNGSYSGQVSSTKTVTIK